MDETVLELDMLLDKIEDLELRVHDYYYRLVKLFPEEEIKAVWSTMANQEVKHSAIIGVIHKLSRKEPHLFLERFEVKRSTIEKIDRFIRTYSEKITSDDFSLDEAFAQALDIETLELNAIYDRIIESLREPYNAIMRELVESEQIHLKVLCEAIKKHARNPELVARAAMLSFEHGLAEQNGKIGTHF